VKHIKVVQYGTSILNVHQLN